MLGETNPWVFVLVLAFLFFILAVFSAKKDSMVRAMAYSAILFVVGVYLVFVHLLPEIRKFHSLVPADCTVTQPGRVMAYASGSGGVAHFALIPVNVSRIDCHGDVGNDISITNMEGTRGWSTRTDTTMCKTGDKIIDGATAYVRLDNWYFLDGDERNFTVDRWEQGKKYFCWSDVTIPEYVTFENDQDWTAILFPLLCLFLIFFLCHASGTFVLLGDCCKLFTCECDPWWLRIDAKTPVGHLKRMRGEYTEVV